MEFKCLSLDSAEIKFSGEGTAFSGYGAVFGGVDSYGDTIHPGAFRHAIGDGAEIKMYFNHNWQRRELPIGKMYVKEDERGLFVEHAEFTKGMRLADEVALAVKHGTVNGLSIGYRVSPDGEKIKAGGKGRDIFQIGYLKEVSVVDWPADQSALITNIKSAIDALESLKDIEALLRDAAGFSRAESCALVSRIRSIAGHGDRDGKNTASIIAQLNSAASKLRTI